MAAADPRLRILVYEHLPAAYHPWDAASPRVAAALAELIVCRDARLRVEHIGSSSVPGCGGKGVIDLAVLYPEGLLEAARQAVDGLGFQRQDTRDPWPESRPMRQGAVEFEGRVFRIHAHVIAAASDEVPQLLHFRDRLRADDALRADYEAAKRRILERGVSDPIDYSIEKGEFVQSALKKCG